MVYVAKTPTELGPQTTGTLREKVADELALIDAEIDIVEATIAQLEAAETSGTTLTGLKIEPTASVATAGINYHKLVGIGDITGTTAFGMGDVSKPSTGLMASFGRTAIATSAFAGTDTGLDVRMINKLANDPAYAMQGAYIKCKNYSTGTVGSMIGLFVEAVADGTETTATILKLGSDGTAIDVAIDMSAVTLAAAAPYLKFTAGGVGIYTYAGTPEEHVTAAAGALCLDTTNGVAYMKTGAGNTGWKLVTQAG